MDKIRAAFIGTGRISDLHAIEYFQNENAEIVAICDTDPQIARRRGRKWGIAEKYIFQDYKKLLDVEQINLVEILVPHHLHYRVAMDAFKAGKNVSLQKPMALNLDDADRLIAEAKASGVVFKVFENFIFYPPVVKAKELIDAGEIGEPLTIRIKSNSGYSPNAWEIPTAAAAWRQNSNTCGGGPLVFDDGHHKFSLAWFFMGMAQQVHAWIDRTEVKPGIVMDSPSVISFKFPNKKYGSLEVVHSPELLVDTRHYAQDDRVEITGTKGVVWITRGHGDMTAQPPVMLYRDGKTTAFSHMPVGWEHSFILSARHFIRALLNDTKPSLTGEEGRNILQFALAAQESAKQGKRVTI